MSHNLPSSVTPPIPFDNSYARLPSHFHSGAQPTPVSEPWMIAFNRPLSDELGLETDVLEAQAAAIFSGNSVPAGAEPMGLAYAGHQFGQFVPLLGDGRAILLGEVVDRAGHRRDIQLKGAGKTPYSRRGDGRAAIGPVMREYIVSEAMHALGLPTTRALAAVITGDPVYRETVQPGAVLTRVAASHIRVGTFQFLAARGDTEGLRTLADHVMDRHDPEAKLSDNPYLALLEGVAERQASLIARWMHVGFIHGVMNTDNSSISGETLDYGPCAFLDAYHSGKVFSSIDRGGRYAYGNQPSIGQWNLARLAETLLPLLSPIAATAVDLANDVVAGFAGRFQRHWLQGMRAKIGLDTAQDGDQALIQALLDLMETHEADFTLTFRRLGDCATGRSDADGVFAGLFSDPQAAQIWLSAWRARLSTEEKDGLARQAAMNAVNPAFIPRNHRIEEAIVRARDDGDLSLFEALNEMLAKPYDDQPRFASFANPPLPGERVERTFCGT